MPAARDVLLSGSLIPHSTPSNAHPPLVMAYLALWWKIAGFAPVVTRTAMLLVASFSLLGLFRLAETVANREVAFGAMICTALYPVFFAQSSLAHLDLAAAGLTFWGLYSYVKGSNWQTALWFSLAALAKETAILAPLALLAWDLISRLAGLQKWKHLATGVSPPSAEPNAASASALAADGMVCLPLFADRNGFRQSGIFPLQRGGNASASANPAGIAHPPVADVWIPPSIDTDCGDVIRNVASRASCHRKRSKRDWMLVWMERGRESP